MKHYFIYWAPEVLLDKPMKIESDIWALGIVCYLLVVGDYPFDIQHEEVTIDNIISVNLDWRAVSKFPRILKLLQNVIVFDVSKRWTAIQILQYCQDEFAIIIQRFWKGIK